jgi:hypothetical protein
MRLSRSSNGEQCRSDDPVELRGRRRVERSAIGREFGPRPLSAFDAEIGTMLASLGLPRHGERSGLPVGLLPPGVDLVTDVLDVMAEGGAHTLGKRLFVGLRFHYHGAVDPRHDHRVTAKVVDVTERSGGRGTFDYGTFELRFEPLADGPGEPGARLQVQWTFAERKGAADTTRRDGRADV